MDNKAIYKARVSKAVSALQILPAVATSHPKQILQLVDQMQTQIQLDSRSWVCTVWSTVLGLLAALVLGALAVLVVVVLAKSEALRQVIVVVETCHEVVKLPGMPRHEELEDFLGDLESEVSNQASSIWTMQEMASSAQCLHGKTSIDKRDWIFERRDQWNVPMTFLDTTQYRHEASQSLHQKHPKTLQLQFEGCMDDAWMMRAGCSVGCRPWISTGPGRRSSGKVWGDDGRGPAWNVSNSNESRIL